MTKAKNVLIATVLVGTVVILISQRRERSRLNQEIATLQSEKKAFAENKNRNSERTIPGRPQAVETLSAVPDSPNRSVAELMAETAALFEKSKGNAKSAIFEDWTHFLSQIPRNQIGEALLELSKLPPGDAIV